MALVSVLRKDQNQRKGSYILLDTVVKKLQCVELSLSVLRVVPPPPINSHTHLPLLLIFSTVQI
jgi:hypothetical protein